MPLRANMPLTLQLSLTMTKNRLGKTLTFGPENKVRPAHKTMLIAATIAYLFRIVQARVEILSGDDDKVVARYMTEFSKTVRGYADLLERNDKHMGKENTHIDVSYLFEFMCKRCHEIHRHPLYTTYPVEEPWAAGPVAAPEENDVLMALFKELTEHSGMDSMYGGYTVEEMADMFGVDLDDEEEEGDDLQEL